MQNAIQPTIIYFPIRGRAEPIRLMLEELDIAYVDEALDYPAWQTLKLEMPFGKVRVYRQGDLCVAGPTPLCVIWRASTAARAEMRGK